MCGIVYYNNKNGKSVNKLVKQAYKAQRERGSDGFGFFTPNNNRLTHNVNEHNILRLLNRTKQSEILFHHRYPTSTNNVRNACHPFSTKDYYKNNYVMVHNGVIWNDDVLSKEHFKSGIRYVSKQKDGRFNDSEVLMYDLANYIEGKTDHIKSEGSIAFIMVQLDKNGKRKSLYFGRNYGSPLKIKKYANGFSLTSEGDGTLIETDKLFKYNYKTKRFSSKPLLIPYMSYNSTTSFGYTQQDDDYNWYKGTRYAYGYDKDGYQIDQNGNILCLPETTNNKTFTENSLERYRNLSYGINNDEETYKQAILDVKNALLYDMNENEETAIDFGQYIKDELKKEYNRLEKLIMTDESDELDLDRYLELDLQIELLQKALEQLYNNQLNLALISGLKD